MNPIRTFALNAGAFFSGCANPFKSTAANPLPSFATNKPAIPAPGQAATEETPHAESRAIAATDTGILSRVLLKLMLAIFAFAFLGFTYGAEHIAGRRNEILLCQQLKDKESELQFAEDNLRCSRATLAMRSTPQPPAADPHLVPPHKSKLHGHGVRTTAFHQRQPRTKSKAKAKRL